MNMKRNVLCLFSLILILLLFFTLVSPKAEEEMQTLVDAREAKGTNYSGKQNLKIGKIAITWWGSDRAFYNIVEGKGWESGMRIAEIPSTYYDVYQSRVEMGSGTDYLYIYSASREPVPGDSVQLVEKTRKGEATYLLWCPGTIENLDRLPYSMNVLQQSENAALVSARQATFPYFEHRVWYSLRNLLGEDMRSYCLSDIQQFLEALPWIAGVATVLLCSLFLWGASWIMAGKMGRRKGVLCLNVLLIIGLLGTLPWLLGKFDLPASMMPREYILDIPHYVQTFERIFSALEAMGDHAVEDILTQAGAESAAVLGVGLLLTAAVIAIEGFLCRSKQEERIDHEC